VASESGVWSEGLLTQVLRRYANDITTLKKWVHLDGPVDREWAENLNSILDDNQLISLPNGEAIKVD